MACILHVQADWNIQEALMTRLCNGGLFRILYADEVQVHAQLRHAADVRIQTLIVLHVQALLSELSMY